MRMFIGGQIQEYRRGDFTVIIKNDLCSYNSYSAFSMRSFTDRFNAVTGMQSLVDSTERIYIGVSLEIGEELVRRADRMTELDSDDFYSLDELVVVPYHSI